jgi:hypothetical protein
MGKGHLVKDCIVSDNGTSSTSSVVGIYVYSDSTVSYNVVNNNGNSVTGSSGTSVKGIQATECCTVTDNTANYNGVMSTVALIAGIHGGTGSTIMRNTANNNGDSAIISIYVSGIASAHGSTLVGNTAYSNGTSATGSVYGISTGTDNFVDQNTAYDNAGINMYIGASCTVGLNHAP